MTVDVAFSEAFSFDILLLGASLSMYESSWDLATPGSPIKQMLMLPIEKKNSLNVLILFYEL